MYVTESDVPALSLAVYLIVYVVFRRTVGSVPLAPRVAGKNVIPGGRPDTKNVIPGGRPDTL